MLARIGLGIIPICKISTTINNLLIKKGYFEKVEDMVLVGNTDEIFSESGQHFNEDIHLPAQAASRSPHRKYLPDKPTPLIDVEQNAVAQDSGPPLAGSADKKQKPRKRKRVPWAQLLKRTFKIDVLKCDNSNDWAGADVDCGWPD